MPLRVLHVIPTLGRGGAERQLVNVATAISPDAFNMFVCQIGGPSDLASELRGAGIDVLNLGLPGRRPWLSAARKLRDVIEDLHPDIVQSWLLDASVPAFLAIRRTIPWIWTLHNPDYDPITITTSDISPLKVAILKLVERRMHASGGATIVAVSNAVRESYATQLRFDRSALRVIPNSVGSERISTDPSEAKEWRRVMGYTEGDFVFLNIARLDPQKGHDTLLRAFAKVPVETRSKLAIVGRGPLESQLRQVATHLGIEERVSFLSPTEHVAALFGGANAFVFPSRFEGFGMALVEAMSAGLPCIASDIPALREVAVGYDGIQFLADLEDDDQFARAMAQLAEGRSIWAAKADMTKSAIAQRFSTLRIVGEWSALYEELTTPGSHFVRAS